MCIRIKTEPLTYGTCASRVKKYRKVGSFQHSWIPDRQTTPLLLFPSPFTLGSAPGALREKSSARENPCEKNNLFENVISASSELPGENFSNVRLFIRRGRTMMMILLLNRFLECQIRF
ncbi:hypothetical protein CEXT_815101 [Caerostris extrusa]|uniref:Ycf15 n=1 Tax=Caerostris extrusa TaxID=172846 RepID=A0AAV4R859_CAEEX|nr:hypothetical protein CEXT_815101 [Caerostris extrusa]